jgi:tripartite-type tricarboxylate transporter receptor subunit TctC
MSQPSLGREYPTRPVRIIVAFLPGGNTDIIARVLSVRLSERTGQTFILDNRGGGGGLVGITMAEKSAPDGYTLLVHYSDIYSNDLIRITGLGASTLVLATSSGRPFATGRDLLDAAKRNPDKFTFAASSAVSHDFYASRSFARIANISATTVPFKGSARAVTALQVGEVDAMFGAIATVRSLIQDGRIRALAVTSPTRSRILPQVPTAKEALGIDFSYLIRLSLFSPSKTPRAVVDKLNGEIRKILGESDVRERLLDMGLEFGPNRDEVDPGAATCTLPKPVQCCDKTCKEKLENCPKC